MVPSLLASGAMTLMISAMMRMMQAEPEPGFLHGWMADWLVTWMIGFPLFCLARLAVSGLARAGDGAATTI